MYVFDLNIIDLESEMSDFEYFTASEDEYFSADDTLFPANQNHPFPTAHVKPSSSCSELSTISRRSFLSSSTASVKSSNEKVSKSPHHKRTTVRQKTNWSVDDSEQRNKYIHKKHVPVDASAMRNYYMWRRAIRAGNHPRDAANMIGAQFCFKQVKQKKNIQLFSIRLNCEHRVFFIIQEKERIVKVLNIGGHSFS